MDCAVSEKKELNLNKIKKLTRKSLEALGKKNFALIVHGNSFPSMNEENTGFGTPNSEGGKSLINFAGGLFDAIQLGPNGKTKKVDSSPYTGTIFSANPLFVDLKQLTTDKWKNILSEKTFSEIVNNNPNKDKNRTSYSYIYEQQEVALKEAFENFKKLNFKKKEFEAFKEENNYWLENDSLYEALSIENGNDYWPAWKSELDRNLCNPKTTAEKTQAKKRIKEIKEKYSDVIEYYAFVQFVLFTQNEQTKKYASTKKLQMIADRQVAFSDRDVWAYQSMFLDGWLLGCPPDYFSKDGQAWGFPVLDPEQLFNKNGSLGKAGKLMKALYKKMFTENTGGVRIDHLVGLIDPWVYKKGAVPLAERGAGRLYSSPEHPELSKYAIATNEDLDFEMESDKEHRVKSLNKEQVKRYGAFIEKIIIAAAKEVGLDKDSIICEDLGTLTHPVEMVMEQYKLQGMKLTQFVEPTKPKDPYRFCNITPNSWVMVGTHDNKPILTWAKSTINTEIGYLHAQNLVSDMYSDKTDKEKQDLIYFMNTDAKFLTKTKFIEMFASPAENVQIFFTDLLGLEEAYNCPGTTGDSNWSLRVPNNFEEVYAENLKNGIGLNLLEVLEAALVLRNCQDKKLLKELRENI